MNIIIVGEGPRAAWVEGIIARLRAAPGAAGEGTMQRLGTSCDRNALHALVQTGIDIVVAVDAASLAQGSPHDTGSWHEMVRRDAERAIFIRELAARASCRVLALVGDDHYVWLGALARMLSLSDVDPGEVEALPAVESGTTPGSSLVASYLDPLWRGLTGPMLQPIVWPRECFLNGDFMGEPLPLVMELAGRARILLYGPYLPLPTGHWRATGCFGFSPDIEKLPFIFEAVTPNSVMRGFFEVDTGGFFTVDLEFQITDLLVPIEIRLASQDSALEGQAALIEVRLEAIG